MIQQIKRSRTLGSLLSGFVSVLFLQNSAGASFAHFPVEKRQLVQATQQDARTPAQRAFAEGMQLY